MSFVEHGPLSIASIVPLSVFDSSDWDDLEAVLEQYRGSDSPGHSNENGKTLRVLRIGRDHPPRDPPVDYPIDDLDRHRVSWWSLLEPVQSLDDGDIHRTRVVRVGGDEDAVALLEAQAVPLPDADRLAQQVADRGHAQNRLISTSSLPGPGWACDAQSAHSSMLSSK